MNKAFFYIIFFFCLNDPLISQNLVPNAGFEEYWYCPDTASNLLYDSNPNTPEPCPKYWYDPTFYSSDYFNICSTLPLETGIPQNAFGWQHAHSGYGYCGFAGIADCGTWCAEYISISLLSPLNAGDRYYVSFWISLADSICYANNMLGAYFSSDSIDYAGSPIINLNPQIKFTQIISDKINWVLMKQSFVAAGGEKYMAISLFDTTGVDTIGVPCSGNSLVWSNYHGSYYYIDDVVVSIDPNLSIETNSSMNDFLSQNYPNPFLDSTSINYQIPANSTHNRIQIRNNLGLIVKEIQIINTDKEQININGMELTPGIYYYCLISDGNQIGSKKMIKK